ncbi:AAA family ATPase [Thalassotalea aquiviva]|uniref:AAA family ATPase n=1 Tax=Thalassotalea aquiviva TaxID=3242415 RepID=UPI00352A44B7
MLKRIILENFKVWEKLDLDIGRVTGIFGTNSSGKSSLIHMLLMLKQTKNNSDRGIALDFGSEEKLADLGTYHDVVSQHEESRNLSFTLSWQLVDELKIQNIEESSRSVLFNGKDLELSSNVGLKGKLLEVKNLSYKFAGSNFSIIPKENKSNEFELKAEVPDDKNKFRFIRTLGRNWKLPQATKYYLFPDQAKTYYQNADFLSQFESALEECMDNIYYLGPLRSFPKRSYQWSGTSPSDVGQQGELTINAILAATLKGEKRNLTKGTRYKTFQEMVAYWLKELGLIHNFRVEEIAPNSNHFKTYVQKENGSAEVAITDVGFGVSQILPVIVLLYYVAEGSTVLLEQPEIHLHPAVQSKLADLILTVSQTRNIQVIVESHSEHFIRRLQRRVAEDKAESSDLKLYFFSTKRGKASYKQLELDDFGAIHNWPDNFFGNEMEEISATRKAALLKRKAAQESQTENA